MITLRLERSRIDSNGAFGALVCEDRTQLCVTLEHAYQFNIQTGNEPFEAKVPAGTYTCKRGVHELEHGGPFETFEVTNVPGHTGILFHVGNTKADSNGCILVGRVKGDNAIFQSRAAFVGLMQYLAGENEFTLVVA